MKIVTSGSLKLVLWTEGLLELASRSVGSGALCVLPHCRPIGLEARSCCSLCEPFAAAMSPPYSRTPHYPVPASNELTSPAMDRQTDIRVTTLKRRKSQSHPKPLLYNTATAVGVAHLGRGYEYHSVLLTMPLS